MAKITLQDIGHSYETSSDMQAVWALKEIDQIWVDGGAYALLGPSGCGKTTLLNIISGLLKPTRGKVLFDDVDITGMPTIERHIAQVFQFPVVYDTMTVFDNLAFPLRNRGVEPGQVDARVREIAGMLDLDGSLDQRASGLTADGKQKISLGRGLVRSDVNVIMFDEPLTVIDPHLKWRLRSKLKELHQQFGATMIYVTHDQTEALTFADNVVVMFEGQVVQIGTPVELFERPAHTFVGHFIGSPGMNVLPCEVTNSRVQFDGNELGIGSAVSGSGDHFEVGIRPEFVSFDSAGFPVEIVKVDDLGRHQVVETRHGEHTIKLIVEEDVSIPGESPRITFDPGNTRLYENGWVVDSSVING